MLATLAGRARCSHLDCGPLQRKLPGRFFDVQRGPCGWPALQQTCCHPSHSPGKHLGIRHAARVSKNLRERLDLLQRGSRPTACGGGGRVVQASRLGTIRELPMSGRPLASVLVATLVGCGASVTPAIDADVDAREAVVVDTGVEHTDASLRSDGAAAPRPLAGWFWITERPWADGAVGRFSFGGGVFGRVEERALGECSTRTVFHDQQPPSVGPVRVSWAGLAEEFSPTAINSYFAMISLPTPNDGLAVRVESLGTARFSSALRIPPALQLLSPDPGSSRQARAVFDALTVRWRRPSLPCDVRLRISFAAPSQDTSIVCNIRSDRGEYTLSPAVRAVIPPGRIDLYVSSVNVDRATLTPHALEVEVRTERVAAGIIYE